MFTSCFPLPPHAKVAEFTSECQSSELNGTNTCLCIGNACNRRPRLKTSSLEEQNTVKRFISIENTTSTTVRHSRYLPSATTKKAETENTEYFILVISSVPVLILAIACLLTLHARKTNFSVAKPENPFDVVTTACNTESLEFNIQRVLGCGTYSKVWLTTYKGSTAAVKAFTSSASSLWQNEKNIYLQNCIKHGNILQFLAAEEKEYNGEHKLYLITDYCEFGSLMEYLTSYKLEWKDVIVMVSGLAAGVAHLHSDWLSNGCIKCAIAHQDIKSSNVLVNGKRECVIGDFGLAVPIIVKQNMCATSGGQVGTTRYMAPEKLEARIDLTSTEALKQIDVYAMALVIWEIVSQFVGPKGLSEPQAYQLPFQDDVGENPTTSDMINIVLRRGVRPTLPEAWDQCKGVEKIKGTIEECWDADPEARLTAECVYHRTTEFQRKLSEEIQQTEDQETTNERETRIVVINELKEQF